MIAPAIKPSMLSQKKGEKSPFPVAVTSTPSHTACRDTCQPTLSSVATLEARYKMMNVKRLLTVISRRNVKHHRHTTVGGLDGLQCLKSQVSRALELQSRSFFPDLIFCWHHALNHHPARIFQVRAKQVV